MKPLLAPRSGATAAGYRLLDSLREAMMPRREAGVSQNAGCKRAMHELEFTHFKDMNTLSLRNGEELGRLQAGKRLRRSQQCSARGRRPNSCPSQPGTAREHCGMTELSATGSAPGNEPQATRGVWGRNGCHSSKMLQGGQTE